MRAFAPDKEPLAFGLAAFSVSGCGLWCGALPCLAVADDGGNRLPFGWACAEAGWLLESRWFSVQFATMEARHARLEAAIHKALELRAPGLVEATLGVVRSVFAVDDGVGLGQLFPLRKRLAELLRETDPLDPSRLLYVVIAALDDAARFTCALPVTAALDAVGWQTIPREYSAVVVELSLLLQQRRGLRVQGLDGSSQPAGYRQDAEDIRRCSEAIDTDDDAQPYRQRRRLDARASVLASLVAIDVKAEPGLGWIRSGSPQDAIGCGSVPLSFRPDYYMTLIERLDRQDSNTIALCQAMADTAEVGELVAIEQFTAALAQYQGGVDRADLLLWGAMRAQFTGRGDDAQRLAGEALAACPDQSNAPRRVAAAALLGHLHARDDDNEANRWYAKAVAACDLREAETFRCPLILARISGLQRVGDQIALRRIRPAVRRLTGDAGEGAFVRRLLDQACAPAGVSPVDDAPAVPDELGLSALAGELLEPVLNDETVCEAYQSLSRRIGELLAIGTPSVVRGQLQAACLMAEAQLERVKADEALTAWRSSAGFDAEEGSIGVMPWATIVAWLCGALADLHELDGDEDGWSSYKTRQVELEERYGARPETLAEAGLTRLERSLFEAEECLARGLPRRAKFWAQIARTYPAKPEA